MYIYTYIYTYIYKYIYISTSLFLIHLFNQLDIKRIKNVMYDYYSTDDITRAKDRLVGDVAKLQIDGLPRVSSRRDSANRSCLEIDDMFSRLLFSTSVDQWTKLPRAMLQPIRIVFHLHG